MMKQLIIVLIVMVGMIAYSESKLIQGDEFKAFSHWTYLDKFALNPDAHIEVSIDFLGRKGTNLLLYSDVMWDNIINSKINMSLTCSELVEMAHANVNSVSDYNSGRPILVTQMRTRWWYLVFADCNSYFINARTTPRTLVGAYTINLINNGDPINTVISADEQFVPHVAIVMFILMVVVLGVSIHSTVVLHRLHYNTMMMCFFNSVVVLKLVGLATLLAFYGAYVSQQTNFESIRMASTIIDISARAAFGMILMLVARGWSISTLPASIIPRVITSLMFVIYLVASVAIYVAYNQLAMPWETFQSYLDNVPGYVLLGFIAVMLIYFIATIVLTRREQIETVNRKFFVVFGSIFSFWFLMHFGAMIINHVCDAWVRYRAVTTFNLLIETLLYILFAGLFVGCRHNRFLHLLNTKGQVLDEQKANTFA